MKDSIVNFYPNSSKAKKQLILISVSWNGNRIRTTLNISIVESSWDKKNQRVKRNYTRALEINRFLDNVKNDINNYYFQKRAIGIIPTIEEIKTKVYDWVKPVEEIIINEKTLSFIEEFELFINETIEGKRLNNDGQSIKRGTYKTYITTKNHLIQFAKKTSYELSFDKMNSDFFSKFINYLTKLSHTTNYQANHIKVLKTFLHYAEDKGLINNSRYVKDFSIRKKDTNLIALSFEELNKIEDYKPESNRLINIKDLFLMQIYTGLRYSDLSNLKPENIDLREGIIKIQTIKTSEPLIVPIGVKLEEIITKYVITGFPKFSNQKFNDYIKELCKLAEIDTLTQVIKYIGSKRIEELKPKYELISSHTSRRTYITLALKEGYLPEMVMKISGHKDRRSFQKYVRISQEEAVKRLRSLF